MKSWGAIRVEVHMLRALGVGVWRRWYLTIHVRNAEMHVKLPDRGCNVRMRAYADMYAYAYAYIHTYRPTTPYRRKIALQCCTTTACGECNTGQC
jgi:hypothetical protein